MKMKKMAAIALAVTLALSSGVACGKNSNIDAKKRAGSASGKSIVIGDTTFNSSNEEGDVNPHKAYSGWACIRYGVGETLVKFSDTMEMEPWLATGWENPDDLTWNIT